MGECEQSLKSRHPYCFAHDRPYRAGGALLAGSITSPSNNASFTPSTSITVTANASDADGTISQVQIFDTGNNLLGTVTQAHMDDAHINPVKHGLVKRVKDWPYSTFYQWVEQGVYMLDCGGSMEGIFTYGD